MSAPVSPNSQPTTRSEDATIGRLVAEASRDLSALVQAEVKLAKSELSFSAKAGGIGTGMFLVAGYLLALVTVLVSIGFALLLASFGVAPVWAFFIVSGVYVLLAAIVLVVGIVLIKKVKAPTQTIKTAKELPAAFKN
jgi:hypothetical protein